MDRCTSRVYQHVPYTCAWARIYCHAARFIEKLSWSWTEFQIGFDWSRIHQRGWSPRVPGTEKNIRNERAEESVVLRRCDVWFANTCASIRNVWKSRGSDIGILNNNIHLHSMVQWIGYLCEFKAPMILIFLQSHIVVLSFHLLLSGQYSICQTRNRTFVIIDFDLLVKQVWDAYYKLYRCNSRQTKNAFCLQIWKEGLKFFIWFSPRAVVPVRPINYRCKDVRSRVPVSCMTISNPEPLYPSRNIGVYPGIRSWNKHLSGWARC